MVTRRELKQHEGDKGVIVTLSPLCERLTKLLLRAATIPCFSLPLVRDEIFNLNIVVRQYCGDTGPRYTFQRYAFCPCSGMQQSTV